MKTIKTSFNVVYLRFVPFNYSIKIILTTNIYNEQFSLLCFYPHFISLSVFSSINSMSWPKDGWIMFDKICEPQDVILFSVQLSWTSLQDVMKFLKKKISYDVRCLKNFEAGVFHNKAMTNFIEQVAQSNNLLFKRTQLRQLKRVYNQRLALCQFKSVNQPSKFKNLANVWEFIQETFKTWFKIIEEPILLDLDFDLSNGLVEPNQESTAQPASGESDNQ